MSEFPKRMLVWDKSNNKNNRIVLSVTDSGRAVCVSNSYEDEYIVERNFRVKVWSHCEELTKKRIMTRNEILGFLEHTAGVVTRLNKGEWTLHQHFCYNTLPVINYQWATIDEDGVIGEPQEFVK